jgi:hypothetical protein
MIICMLLAVANPVAETCGLVMAFAIPILAIAAAVAARFAAIIGLFIIAIPTASEMDTDLLTTG